MNKTIKSQNGSVTLIIVFFITIIAFLFVFSDNVKAVKDQLMTQSDATTEQAFYAAQSCVEEGFLHLRTDAEYRGGDFDLGEIKCTIEVTANTGTTGGLLTATGYYQDKVRTVSTQYTDAGPATQRNSSTVFHIIDRTGTMDDDGHGCTLATYRNQADCQSNGGVWGLQPITSAKESAKQFIDYLDVNYDKVGVVSYNTAATLNHAASNNYLEVKNAIDAIGAPIDFTNTGEAIAMATTQLDGAPVTDTKVEILLTDGQANRPTDIATAENYALIRASEAKARGIIIFTIGLGSAVNQNFLQQAASTVDGQTMYFYAPAAQDLASIYQRIAVILLSFNIGQNTWQEK